MNNKLDKSIDIHIWKLYEGYEDEEIDNILSDNNLQKIVENSNTPKQLKDCIMLEKESQIVCREMYEYIL